MEFIHSEKLALPPVAPHSVGALQFLMKFYARTSSWEYFMFNVAEFVVFYLSLSRYFATIAAGLSNIHDLFE